MTAVLSAVSNTLLFSPKVKVFEAQLRSDPVYVTLPHGALGLSAGCG